MAKPAAKNQSLRSLEIISRLMDSQFRIPGTEMRFGMDAIIGLIPGAGDFAGLLVSGYMVSVMAKNGASGFVLARICLNVLIDALLGSIPFLGDIFDFAFKANDRNMRLMHQHYKEGRHQGGAWKVLVPILLVLTAFVSGIVWLTYKFFDWIFQALS